MPKLLPVSSSTESSERPDLARPPIVAYCSDGQARTSISARFPCVRAAGLEWQWHYCGSVTSCLLLSAANHFCFHMLAGHIWTSMVSQQCADSPAIVEPLPWAGGHFSSHILCTSAVAWRARSMATAHPLMPCSSRQVITSPATASAHLHSHSAPESWRQSSLSRSASMDSNQQVSTSPATPSARLQ